MTNFNEETFQKDVLDNAGLALVDFWAAWCGPCRMLGPIIEELAGELEGQHVKVGKVNVEEQVEIAARYQIRTIPTVILFKNGQEVERSVGVFPKQKFLDMVHKHR